MLEFKSNLNFEEIEDDDLLKQDFFYFLNHTQGKN